VALFEENKPSQLTKKEEKKKNYGGSETAPYVNQEKGDTLARRAVRLLHQRNKGLVRIWKVTSRSLLPDWASPRL